MDKKEFDATFREVVAGKLAPLGFKLLGETLTFKDELRTISLLRLGGKMTMPGKAVHVLCFRHSFLRDFNNTISNETPTNPHEYPFKFEPLALQEDRSTRAWRYQPQNLRFPRGEFSWSERDPAAVSTELVRLADFLAMSFVPWTLEMAPDVAEDQIRRYGEGAWCEKIWLDDYSAWLSRSPRSGTDRLVRP